MEHTRKYNLFFNFLLFNSIQKRLEERLKCSQRDFKHDYQKFIINLNKIYSFEIIRRFNLKMKLVFYIN